MPVQPKEPTIPTDQTGLIVRDAKGRFIQQPPRHVRGNNAHRPSEYTEELQAHADKWLDQRIANRKITWLEELAIELGVSDTTLTNWANETDDKGVSSKPKFLATYSRLMTYQKLVLKNNGISGVFNPRMSMFLLSANHETVEKREVKSDVTSGGKPVDMTGIPTATTEGVNEFITQGLKQKYISPTR